MARRIQRARKRSRRPREAKAEGDLVGGGEEGSTCWEGVVSR